MKHSHFAFTGPDAENFLQRLSTLDMRTLPRGEARPACFLSPSGKFCAYFSVTKKTTNNNTNEFSVTLDPGPSQVNLQGFLEFTDRYHFGENLGMSSVSDVETQEAREFERIMRLEPRVGFEITDQVGPLELGLVQLFEKTKGCYPGQEVIERILTTGAPPRRLVRLRGEGVEASSIGEVTSSVAAPEGGWVALAIVRKASAVVRTELTPGVHIDEVSQFKLRS